MSKIVDAMERLLFGATAQERVDMMVELATRRLDERLALEADERPVATINTHKYPLYGQRVRVLPIPGLTGEVVGVMPGNVLRYRVRLDTNDGAPCVREFLPDELEVAR